MSKDIAAIRTIAGENEFIGNRYIIDVGAGPGGG